MDDSQKTTQPTGFLATNGLQNNPNSQSDVTQQNQNSQSQIPPVQSQQHPVQTDAIASQPEAIKLPEVPVSAPSKEGGPAFPSGHETLVKASTPDMEVVPELKEVGVEAKQERPTLTPADVNTEMVQHAKESVPVSTVPTSTIVLPMTQQQAQQTIKLHKKVKDSLYWLAMLIARQWQIAHKGEK